MHLVMRFGYGEEEGVGPGGTGCETEVILLNSD